MRNKFTGFKRLFLFALTWWILTEGAMSSWFIGVPIILLATAVSQILVPPVRWSFPGFLSFIPFFLKRSLYGGFDVAIRACHPGLPIKPVMYEHYWQLAPGIPRFFMASTVSLLPGTLSAKLNNSYLLIHILDSTGNHALELNELERHVQRIFPLDHS